MMHLPLLWLHVLQLPHEEVIQYFKPLLKQSPVFADLPFKSQSKEFL